MKILIVDDSRAMRMIVRRNLNQVDSVADAEIIEAENGEEALGWFAGGTAPDIVFSDWNMPGMNGIELLRSLRNAGIEVPFGFVTSEKDEDMWAEAIAEGASFMISKPFTVHSFAERLAEIGF